MDNDHIPLLLTRLLYEFDDPQATLAESRRVLDVLEKALSEAGKLDGPYLLTH